MTKVFYARVSTKDQDLDVQRAKAEEVGAEKTYEEKISGLDQGRPQLKACLDYLRDGDTLYVMRADRLGRSTSHLLKIMEDLKEKGVQVVFTEQPELSTNTPQGKLMLSILAAIAEFETALRAERQAEGIAKAKQKGIRFGRKPKLTDAVRAQIRKLRQDGMPIGDIQTNTGLGRSTVYRALEDA